AAAQLDKPVPRDPPGRHCYASASGSEQASNNVVREQQHVGSQCVAGHQQPPAEPLLQRVITVANARLRNLDEKRIRILQQKIAQKWIAPEFFIHALAGDSKSIAAHLNDRPVRRTPPRIAGTPTMPSFPMSPISRVAPSEFMERMDTRASFKK